MFFLSFIVKFPEGHQNKHLKIKKKSGNPFLSVRKNPFLFAAVHTIIDPVFDVSAQSGRPRLLMKQEALIWIPALPQHEREGAWKGVEEEGVGPELRMHQEKELR